MTSRIAMQTVHVKNLDDAMALGRPLRAALFRGAVVAHPALIAAYGMSSLFIPTGLHSIAQGREALRAHPGW